MEVYCEVFDLNLQVIRPLEAVIIDANSFNELLSTRRVLFFGNGSDKCRDVLNSDNAVFIGDVFPTASTLGMLAGEKFARKEFEDLAGFAPVYLKEFIAKEAKPLI